MEDATIAELEKWLRERARESEREATERAAADSTDPAQDQEQRYWPYLDTEDFWRE